MFRILSYYKIEEYDKTRISTFAKQKMFLIYFVHEYIYMFTFPSSQTVLFISTSLLAFIIVTYTIKKSTTHLQIHVLFNNVFSLMYS